MEVINECYREDIVCLEVIVYWEIWSIVVRESIDI